ncbi:MAG: ATP phosphoribosyltransferase regulatory subunit [Clostridia bacterium]|nr:ATP phosphoribosyltransferase regulatory subunit [Clostridia bacterium]
MSTVYQEPINRSLSELYASYGYSPFKMSKFEEYELYAQNKNFLISDHVITFTDTTGRLMALKPDVTLAIVKNTKDEPSFKKKLYYTESVYRVSQKSGTFREIEQAGVEVIGDIDAYCLGEVLTMAEKSLAAVSPDSVLAVSQLDLLMLAVDALGIPKSREGEVLDCIGEKNQHGIGVILAEEGLPEENTHFLKALLTHYGKPSYVLSRIAPYCKSEGAQSILAEFTKILSLVREDRVVVDFSTLGDLRYYNGIVFRGYVNGIAENLLSGGEYNRLMQKMNKKSHAVGFAVYLDLLDDFGKTLAPYDCDVLILYKEESSDLLAVMEKAESLRREGLTVSVETRPSESKRYRTVYTV